jgi:hypothetical protein
MSGNNNQFSLEHLKKVKSGVSLYNKEFWWECHEELEDHWLEDQGDPARFVYWVIIQVATSLLHHRDGNLAGARGMILKAQDKVLRCKKAGVESDILYRFLSWKRFTMLVSSIKENCSLSDFEELSKFKFSHPEKWDIHIKKLENEKTE